MLNVFLLLRLLRVKTCSFLVAHRQFSRRQSAALSIRCIVIRQALLHFLERPKTVASPRPENCLA